MTLSLFGFSQKQILSTSHLFERNRKYPWRCGKAIKWKIGALSYRDAAARCKATSLNYSPEHKELGSSMVFRLWLLYLSCGYLDGAALHSCSWRTFSETGLGSQLGLQESWRDVWRGTPSVYSRPPPSGSHSEMHKIHWITKQANYIEIQFYPQTPWGVPRLRRPARISFQHEIIWFYDQ